MPLKQSIQTVVRSVTQPKTVLVLLSVLVIALAASSFYLLRTLDATRIQLGQAGEDLTFILAYSKDKEAQLNIANEDLAQSRLENQGLNDQIVQLNAEKGEAEAQAALYRAQKYFFLDALDWVGKQYGYLDVEQMARLYSLSSGQNLPRNCEIESPERYEHWVSTRSTIFVVSPVKIGLSNYAWWSLRENVLFGPDHFDEPGYIGSRGYELRYPLAPGTWPLQEIHTTINVYEDPVAENYWKLENYETVVDLNCGTKGYITVDNDVDETKTIYFLLGDFAANVKLKYYYNDFTGAVSFLTVAANAVIDDLTAGW